jgi:hypothetical protein
VASGWTVEEGINSFALVFEDTIKICLRYLIHF